ncbi:hypothetical protein [Bradyrhizobium sp. 145]|uniref:hypothetical protein n=1 Tax=Bradyrhizobium sp. 145 TaxID=2782621 RepID=UPI001FF7016B|nr:hypothetical protein [Bradyrhizobium sp. 145]
MLVFGAMWLVAKYLSAALPRGFWYSILAAIICIVAALPIGLGVGIIMSASAIGGDLVRPGEYYLDGMRTGTLAIFAIPFLIALYRRKRVIG